MDIENYPIKLNNIKFHTIIFKYTKEYPKLFKEFMFDNNGPFPYCEQIDEILSTYRYSGVMDIHNGKDCFISGQNKRFAERIKQEMSPIIYNKLIKIGKKECLNFR